MWWLAIFAGFYFFRERIAGVVGPYLGAVDPDKTVFYGHIVTLVACILYVLPIEFVGLHRIKMAGYMLTLWSVVMNAILKIKMNYGPPPMPQISLSFSNIRQTMTQASQVMAPWLQKVMLSGVDFHFLFFAVMFLNAYPSLPVILILGRRSLWIVATYCAKNLPQNRIWTMFAARWIALKAQEEQIMVYAALAEIILGIYLVVSIFLPQRQLLTTILYWNFLKTRYQVPRSQKYMLPAWQSLAQQVQPVVNMVPFLSKPIDMAKGWFTASPG